MMISVSNQRKTLKCIMILFHFDFAEIKYFSRLVVVTVCKVLIALLVDIIGH